MLLVDCDMNEYFDCTSVTRSSPEPVSLIRSSMQILEKQYVIHSSFKFWFKIKIQNVGRYSPFIPHLIPFITESIRDRTNMSESTNRTFHKESKGKKPIIIGLEILISLQLGNCHNHRKSVSIVNKDNFIRNIETIFIKIGFWFKLIYCI